MKSRLGARCDEMSASGRLNLKLGLSLDREAVLHLFDRVRREHPTMKRMRRRHDGSVILEEGEPDLPDAGPRRWIRLDSSGIRFGYYAPPAFGDWRGFGKTLLEYVPYYLSLSDLDIDQLEVVYTFDMEYSGNHDQLVAETLFRDHPLASFMLGEEAVHIVDCQPSMGIALTQACDVQAYLEIKSRTTTFEVRTSEYEAQLLSVYLTIRRYWGMDQDMPLPEAFLSMTDAADELAAQRIVPLVVNPLVLAIGSQP